MMMDKKTKTKKIGDKKAVKKTKKKELTKKPASLSAGRSESVLPLKRGKAVLHTAGKDEKKEFKEIEASGSPSLRLGEKKEKEIIKPVVPQNEENIAVPSRLDSPLLFRESEASESRLGESARYFEAVGRRKTSFARVRLFTQGEKELIVNNKPYTEYFSAPELQQIAISSLKKMKGTDRFRVVALVKGGGIHSQSEAVRHGIARVLVKFNPDFRKRLRKAGYITRDPRARERKKFGLKRARRAPQWAKR